MSALAICDPFTRRSRKILCTLRHKPRLIPLDVGERADDPVMHVFVGDNTVTPAQVHSPQLFPVQLKVPCGLSLEWTSSQATWNTDSKVFDISAFRKDRRRRGLTAAIFDPPYPMTGPWCRPRYYWLAPTIRSPTTISKTPHHRRGVIFSL